MAGPPLFSFHFDQGDLCLPGLELWLDPKGRRDFAFVSHAHGDHYAPHRRILCSRPTRRIIEARYGSGGEKADFLDLDFGESLELEGHRLELLPAGHIAGSAMLFVERLGDGASLLHTGDFKSRPSAGAEPLRSRRAGTLLLETTFGLPKYRFPPAGEVIEGMLGFVREALEDGEVPVLMAYTLGKAQEILMELHQRDPGLVFQVHESVARMNTAVAGLGYELPPCEVFSPENGLPEGRVMVVPPGAGRSQALQKQRHRIRLAMVSGWGMDPAARFRYQCDEVFPLSDHADYDELLALVEAVDPTRTYTIHGFTAEFAADLRRRGRDAWPLAGETQLEFAPLMAAAEPPLETVETGGEGPTSDPDSEFDRLAELGRRLRETRGKLAKRALLASFLASLEPGRLELAVRFLAANPFPRSGGSRRVGPEGQGGPESGPPRPAVPRSAQVGSATIREALVAASGLDPVQFRQVAASQADLARTAYLVLQGRTRPTSRSLPEVAADLEALAAETGPGGRARRLAEVLSGLHPASAALFVGILVGDLRIGLKEGLLEEAIGEAFAADPAELREANMLLGDLGETARLAREGRLGEAGVTWFNPLRVMLASPEETAAGIFERLGRTDGPVWLEDKLDGIRAQVHCRDGAAEIYSRDLRPLGEEFPELVEAAAGFGREVILDGEIIAHAEGRRLGFFDLQKRLGRRDPLPGQGDLFFGGPVPVRFVAFDLLGLDGEGWIGRPLSERRAALDGLLLPPSFDRSPVHFAEGARAIEEAFREAKRRGNEGLMAKDPASLYLPGRRGKSWLKLKAPMPTLDVVVVGVQQGHGKRSHLLSDYTFAVRDEEEGGLKVVGKAYSGLTDREIEALTEHFRERTLERRRGYHVVEPDTVLEIAFDSIQASRRHNSGLAMRFPRIKAIRRDKTVAEIDTLAYARKLAGVNSGR